jgi:hypothetical protein
LACIRQDYCNKPDGFYLSVQWKDPNRSSKTCRGGALLDKFIAIAIAATGYAAGVLVPVSPGSLRSLLSTIKGANTSLCPPDARCADRPEEGESQPMDFGPGGVQEKFRALKESVKSQSGTQSPEYAAGRCAGRPAKPSPGKSSEERCVLTKVGIRADSGCCKLTG